MNLESVPQEGNATLGGHRKAMYAKDANGRMVIAPSAGWEAEEIVTSHAVESLHAQAEQARERVKAGVASPLEFWMYERRMDVALLSQTSGFWQWRVRRHLAEPFDRCLRIAHRQVEPGLVEQKAVVARRMQARAGALQPVHLRFGEQLAGRFVAAERDADRSLGAQALAEHGRAPVVDPVRRVRRQDQL